MFENFPYTDMHQLNLDWIVKIAKDFLEQYTTIQQVISTGLENLDEATQTGLASLDAKAQQLETLLNEWYTLHQNYLDETLATNLQTFNAQAEAKAAETIASIPADYTALSELVDSLIAIFQANVGIPGYGLQLIDPLDSNYHASKRWNAAGGLSNASADYVAVQVPVVPGERYCGNMYASFSYFFNQSNSSVTPITVNYLVHFHETELAEVIIPANTTHLLVTLSNIATVQPMLFKVYNQFFYKPNNFKVAYNHPIIDYKDFSNQFWGYNYYSFGDSITWLNNQTYSNLTNIPDTKCMGYQHYIITEMGFNHYNHGINGADSNQIKTEVMNTDLSGAYLVTIMTGINDFGRSVPIATFKQNLQDMIDKILTENPYCKIVLLSNTFCKFDQYGYITRDYADAMEEIATLNNIPFIDNMKNNGINASNLANYIADLPSTTYALHPNPDGFAIIGKQVAARIRDLIE